MLDTQEAWTRTSASLRSFLRVRARDEHEAEDLLQETFARIHDGLPGLEDEQRLGPWAFRIARRVLADHARGPRLEVGADAEGLPERGTPEENFNPEVERWLRDMVALLPGEQREAVELAEVQGLTQSDVAQRLGLSLSGAKSRVQRGRARLRQLLLACCHLDFDRHGNVLGYERKGRCGRCSGC